MSVGLFNSLLCAHLGLIRNLFHQKWVADVLFRQPNQRHQLRYQISFMDYFLRDIALSFHFFYLRHDMQQWLIFHRDLDIIVFLIIFDVSCLVFLIAWYEFAGRRPSEIHINNFIGTKVSVPGDNDGIGET